MIKLGKKRMHDERTVAAEEQKWSVYTGSANGTTTTQILSRETANFHPLNID